MEAVTILKVKINTLNICTLEKKKKRMKKYKRKKLK